MSKLVEISHLVLNSEDNNVDENLEAEDEDRDQNAELAGVHVDWKSCIRA